MALISSPPLDPKSNIHLLPAQEWISITPGATALSKRIRGLYVGVSGSVTFTDLMGNSVTLGSLAAGVIHPIAATHVTDATATGILGVVAE